MAPATLLLRGSAALISALLGACAGAPGAGPVALSAPEPHAKAPAPAAAYTLNAEELALDCKKLTGRMQVRILQIRDYEERPQSTGLSRVLQTATTTVIGGTTEGTSPDSRYARDRAVLEAYNAQLAAKGCRTFDLEAELQPKPVSATPTPVAKSAVR